MIRFLAAVAFVTASSLGVAGCTTTAASGPSAGPTQGSESLSPEVQAAVDRGYAGDYAPVPTTGPTAVTGKKVWFISCGQLYIGCRTMATNFAEAGKALSWDVTVQDSEADPVAASSLIRQAIAARIDAVAIASFDCPNIKAALLDAKSAGMPVVNFGGIDCDDKVVGGNEALFTATVKLRGSDRSIDFFNAVSEARAQYVVANAGSRANILWISEQSQAIQKNLGEAFEAEITRICPDCTLTRVPFTFAQVPTPATQIWQTAIQSHPDATVLATSLDSLMPIGLASAIKQSGRQLPVVGGGEGNPPNFEMIRSGDTQTFSVAVAYGWVMYGLADTLNRVFAGDSPDSFPDEGAGWQFIDKDHNLPEPDAEFEPDVDFRAGFRSIWGSN